MRARVGEKPRLKFTRLALGAEAMALDRDADCARDAELPGADSW